MARTSTKATKPKLAAVPIQQHQEQVGTPEAGTPIPIVLRVPYQLTAAESLRWILESTRDVAEFIYAEGGEGEMKGAVAWLLRLGVGLTDVLVEQEEERS